MDLREEGFWSDNHQTVKVKVYIFMFYITLIIVEEFTVLVLQELIWREEKFTDLGRRCIS